MGCKAREAGFLALRTTFRVAAVAGAPQQASRCQVPHVQCAFTLSLQNSELSRNISPMCFSQVFKLQLKMQKPKNTFPKAEDVNVQRNNFQKEA